MPSTKQRTVFGVALAALCLWGCERGDRNDRTDRTDVNDAAEPGVNADGQPVRVDARSREIAEQGGRDPSVGPNTPGSLDAARPPDPPAAGEAIPHERSEFVAAAHRRLDEIDRELQQLDQRSRERGQQLRADMRDEKQRLELDLQRLEKETGEAWTETKAGFADALERLEGEIRQVRQDVEPEA